MTAKRTRPLRELLLICGLKPDSGAEFCSSYAQIAEVTGLAHGTVRNIASEDSGFPPKGKKGYPLAEVIELLIERGAIAELEKADLEKRKLAIECQVKEHELAMKKASMIEASAVERKWTESINRLDAQVIRKGEHLAPKFLACDSAGAFLKLWKQTWHDIRLAVAMESDS